jgi:processing peptidase subunit alpha
VAAYRDNTLGHTLLCPKEQLEFINRGTIDAYRQLLYKPERMVVAFAGVDHMTAVKLSEQYFSDMKRGQGLLLPQLDADGSITTSQSASSPTSEIPR